MRDTDLVRVPPTQGAVMKVKFTEYPKESGFWHSDPEALLSWQQGVIVTHITKTHVGLGSLTGPLGNVERDKIVDDWLDKHVEYIPLGPERKES